MIIIAAFNSSRKLSYCSAESLCSEGRNRCIRVSIKANQISKSSGLGCSLGCSISGIGEELFGCCELVVSSLFCTRASVFAIGVGVPLRLGCVSIVLLRLSPLGMAECHLQLAHLYQLAKANQMATKEYKIFLTKVPNHPDKKKFEKFIKDNPE